MKICLVVGAFPYLHKNILKEKTQTILEVRFKQRKRASGLKRLKSKRLSGSGNGKYYLQKIRELKNKLFYNDSVFIFLTHCFMSILYIVSTIILLKQK